jgi:hypothetical protein
MISGLIPSGNTFFKILHGIQKAASEDFLNQVDRIIILTAIKASGKICLGLDGRMIMAAHGTAEPQLAGHISYFHL